MLLTSAELADVPEGVLLQWIPAPSSEGIIVPEAPPTFNQLNHTGTAREHGGWLCVLFDLPGAFDEMTLRDAYTSLLQRHDGLRSTVGFSGISPQTRCHQGEFSWRRENHTLPGDLADRRHALARIIDETTTARRFPAYLLGAIVGERVTVVVACDHAHVDAVSMALIVRDLAELYAARQSRRAADLPNTAGFLTYAAGAAKDTFDPSDPRLPQWHAFFDRHDRGLPRFALLTNPSDNTSDSTVELRQVLTAAQTQAVAQHARNHGAGMLATLLCASAEAAVAMGGPDTFETLVPVTTRTEPRWRDTIGWMVTNGPVAIEVGATTAQTLTAAQRQVETAIELGRMPLADVIGSYAPGFSATGDVTMVSYLDYRRIDGHHLHDQLRAQQLSASSPATDVQTWWVRNEDGLALRCRFPGTHEAASVVPQWLDHTCERLAQWC
ncbi:condensation domain-containing protein [Rudaeicoccus suwonensis]|uniref:Condensation domain-containing protein n=1 Tax=Rudaeicoccus suwonensis TaxID=657409 RepID=A0A561DX67_9MICO|nr:condensation domain-containing protein [Rudaeicoccus suwonensis]TWE07954.1 condensation domain-containing protein [Rudaeicoccus suwonensis]